MVILSIVVKVCEDIFGRRCHVALKKFPNSLLQSDKVALDGLRGEGGQGGQGGLRSQSQGSVQSIKLELF